MSERLLPTSKAAAHLSPAQAGKRIGHSRGFVMDLIHAGELPARDERRPGADRPCYRIDEDDVIRWQESRTFTPPGRPAPVATTRQVRVTGLLARRRAKRRAAVG